VILEFRTSNTGDGFLARQIGDMDESVVERSEDVGNAKHQLALSNLRTERNGVFLFGYLGLLGRL
jgi:hypothetical protein